MKKAIIGNGGHAKEVIAHLGQEVCIFVTDDCYDPEKKNILPLSEFDSSIYEIMICIGSSSKREQIVKLLPEDTQFFTYIHPTALIIDNNIKIGHGSFIGPYCVITSNVEIGKHSILLRSVNIGHDCTIGDFFSAMSHISISGNVTLGRKIYLGNNSSIREKLTITDDTIIGMNGCVIKNIFESGTYVGLPVKKLKK